MHKIRTVWFSFLFGMREICLVYKHHALFSLSCWCAEKGARKMSLFFLKNVILSSEPTFAFLTTSSIYLHFLKATEKHARNYFMKNVERGFMFSEDDDILYLSPFTGCRQYKKAKVAAEREEAIRRERLRMEKKRYVSIQDCRRSCEILFPTSIPPLG